MFSTLCPRSHASLIFGVCPWCHRQITFGQPVQDFQELKQRILTKLRDRFDASRARGHDALLRGELRKAIQRLCTLKAVTLSSLELDSLVEEILAEFLGEEPEAGQ